MTRDKKNANTATQRQTDTAGAKSLRLLFCFVSHCHCHCLEAAIPFLRHFSPNLTLSFHCPSVPWTVSSFYIGAVRVVRVWRKFKQIFIIYALCAAKIINYYMVAQPQQRRQTSLPPPQPPSSRTSSVTLGTLHFRWLNVNFISSLLWSHKLSLVCVGGLNIQTHTHTYTLCIRALRICGDLRLRVVFSDFRFPSYLCHCLRCCLSCFFIFASPTIAFNCK